MASRRASRSAWASGVAVFHHPARPVPDDPAALHQNCAVRLVTPGFGEAAHGSGGGIPAGAVSVGESLCMREGRAQQQRQTTRDRGAPT
jgi:hypothetical protein